MRRILRTATYRIGRQTLEVEDGPLCPDCGFKHSDTAHDRYFLTIRNRTYRSEVEISKERADWYLENL